MNMLDAIAHVVIAPSRYVHLLECSSYIPTCLCIRDHVRALISNEAWVCVGSSLDLMPLCKAVADLKIIFPRSGTSIWADFFVIPSEGAGVENLGNTHEPSPLVNVWLDYVLSPARFTKIA